jgi:hypothetical protein
VVVLHSCQSIYCTPPGKAGRTTFPLPNGYLKKHGVSREVKRRVLLELETAGLITIERRTGKTPLVTLVVI